MSGLLRHGGSGPSRRGRGTPRRRHRGFITPAGRTAAPAAGALMIVLLAACAHRIGPAGVGETGVGGVRETGTALPDPAFAGEIAELTARGLAIARDYRVAALTSRRFTHDELWTALREPLESGPFEVVEAGVSLQGRSILTVRYGGGPVRVLLWSQMHGDESSATMALADLIAFLARAPDDPLARRLHEALTIVMIPMLNPDGAELFQRRNAVGVDINRDARRLATPEARVLKEVRDALAPDFGFNLHDQNPHTLAGAGGERAAFALLAPAADAERTWTPVRARARHVAAAIAAALAGEVPGRVARYGDAFNPRAFGDLMQQWGTSTVLIETGVLENDPEKQRLRALNVAALITALDVIATGAWERADPRIYEELPPNRGFEHDILIRGGMLVLERGEPVPVDVALTWADGVRREALTVSDVGDLEDLYAYETIDASGLFLHPEPPLTSDESGMRWLVVGETVVLTLRRGPERDSEMVMRLGGH